jgi:hypothetical protein
MVGWKGRHDEILIARRRNWVVAGAVFGVVGLLAFSFSGAVFRFDIGRRPNC